MVRYDASVRAGNGVAMTRRARRSRYLALALELAGAAAVVCGVGLVSLWAALVLGGVLVIVGAQFVEGAL